MATTNNSDRKAKSTDTDPDVKKLFAALSKPGPNRVLRGDLGFAGVPGVLYTPNTGTELPAVAFAHGWMVGPVQYDRTLRHLASWGFVVAAPHTQMGPIPSHLEFAKDLTDALDVVCSVRLGTGEVTVDSTSLALAGHGMGGSAAVLAAARGGRPISALTALYPAPTAPRAESVAAEVSVPALVVGGPTDLVSLAANPLELTRTLHDAVLRTIVKSSRDGVLEGRPVLQRLGIGGAEKKTQRIMRALMTGFLLHRVTGDATYAAFSASDTDIAGTTILDPNEPIPEPTRTRGGAARQLSQILRT